MKKLSCKNHRKNSVAQYIILCAAVCTDGCPCGDYGPDRATTSDKKFNTSYSKNHQRSYEWEQNLI